MTDRLKQIRERLDVVINWRSDDFGHDVQKLLAAESDALQEIGIHTEMLLDLVEVYEEALNKIADPRATDHKWPDTYAQLCFLVDMADKAIALGKEIKGE